MRRRSTGIRRIRFITTCSFTFRFAHRRKSLSTNARLEHTRRAPVPNCCRIHLCPKKNALHTCRILTLNTRVFHSGKGAGRECWQSSPKLAEHSGANLSYARRQFMQHLWKRPKNSTRSLSRRESLVQIPTDHEAQREANVRFAVGRLPVRPPASYQCDLPSQRGDLHHDRWVCSLRTLHDERTVRCPTSRCNLDRKTSSRMEIARRSTVIQSKHQSPDSSPSLASHVHRGRERASRCPSVRMSSRGEEIRSSPTTSRGLISTTFQAQ